MDLVTPEFALWVEGEWRTKRVYWTSVVDTYYRMFKEPGPVSESPGWRKDVLRRSRTEITDYINRGIPHPSIHAYSTYLMDRLHSIPRLLENPKDFHGWISMTFPIGSAWKLYTWDCRCIVMRLDSWDDKFSTCSLTVTYSGCITRAEVRTLAPELETDGGSTVDKVKLNLGSSATAALANPCSERLRLLTASGEKVGHISMSDMCRVSTK